MIVATPLASFFAATTALQFVAVLLGTFVPRGEAAARAFFVFGDSLVDNGNNSHLVTTARADTPPYGIDFPTHHPTGRFSNGLHIPDIISDQLGLSEAPLPYMRPELTGKKLLLCVNFASAGIGVLNDTGVQFLNIIRIYRKFEYSKEYQQRLSSLIGQEQAQRHVNGGLVLTVLGRNDFVNNYFQPFSLRPSQYSLPDFARLVASEYRLILRRLYDLGARKVMVIGTGPLGCVPSELASGSQNDKYVPLAQEAAAIYNPLLVKMLRSLNSEVGSNVFIASNTGSMLIDFIDNPQAYYGFKTPKEACCGQGPYNGLGTCTIASNLCPDRNIYAFWDPFHPTERANRLIVQQMMTGSIKYMNPMNLSTLLALDSRA